MSSPARSVRRVDVTPELREAAGLVRPDFADAFAARLPAGAPDDVELWHDAVLRTSPPTWLRFPMAIRGVLARLLRLDTARFGADGPFRLVSRTADRIVAGSDDRHLDFRVVIEVQPTADGGRELVLVTVVQRHNLVGRAYFALIGPFHRQVVPALLRRAVTSAVGGSGRG